MKALLFILTFTLISADVFGEGCKITVTRQSTNTKAEFDSKEISFSINPEDDSVSHVTVKKDGKEEIFNVMESGSDLLKQAHKCNKK